MKRMFKRVIPSLLLCCVLCFQSVASVQASSPQGQNVFNVSKALYTISSYVESINKKDWNTYISLQPAEEQDGLRHYLTENTDPSTQGILSVDAAQIQEIKNLPTDSFKNFVDLNKYENDYGTIYGFLVGINYNVKNESKYYYNGVNYDLILVGEENGSAKIILDMYAPLDDLESAGYGFNSRTEKNAVKISSDRRKGIYENASGKILSVNQTTTKSPKSLSIQPDSLPSGYPNEPSTIRVYLTGSGQIRTVSFDYDYVADVLSKEWDDSWDYASLESGALMIKAFAWYYIINGSSGASVVLN